MFSPAQNRRPILKSKDQIKEIRENSFISRIIQKNRRVKPSSPDKAFNLTNLHYNKI